MSQTQTTLSISVAHPPEMTTSERYKTKIGELANKLDRFQPLSDFLDLNSIQVAQTQLDVSKKPYATTSLPFHEPSSDNIRRQNPPLPNNPNEVQLVENNSSSVALFTFTEGLAAKITDIKDATKLEEELGKESRQFYIVENLSPEILKLFGGHWDIEPQFFLDYLNLVPKDKNENGRAAKPAPWYRLEDVKHQAPMLRSTKAGLRHVNIQYVGARENDDVNGNGILPLRMKDRVEQEMSGVYVERVGGGHNPIQPNQRPSQTIISAILAGLSGREWTEQAKSKKFRKGAWIRHSTTLWFDGDSSGTWQRGLILLDPRFTTKQAKLGNFGTHYIESLSYPIPKNNGPSIITQDKAPTVAGKNLAVNAPRGTKVTNGTNTPVDKQDISYSDSLLKCLEKHTGIPSPPFILQKISQIISHEWITVNSYLERDINWIEWRLEQTTPSLPILEFFLRQVFIMRRRVRKYEDLLNDQMAASPPQFWLSIGDSKESDTIMKAINGDHRQVLDLLQRNKARIKETVQLITSLMSVVEGKRSNSLNQSIFFLTMVATIALPFPVIGAIYGMEGRHSPGESEWNNVRNMAIGIVCSVVACYSFMILGFWTRNKVVNLVVE